MPLCSGLPIVGADYIKTKAVPNAPDGGASGEPWVVSPQARGADQSVFLWGNGSACTSVTAVRKAAMPFHGSCGGQVCRFLSRENYPRGKSAWGQEFTSWEDRPGKAFQKVSAADPRTGYVRRPSLAFLAVRDARHNKGLLNHTSECMELLLHLDVGNRLATDLAEPCPPVRHSEKPSSSRVAMSPVSYQPLNRLGRRKGTGDGFVGKADLLVPAAAPQLSILLKLLRTGSTYKSE